MNKTFKNLVKELDERKIKPMYHHVLKGKVVASGSASNMRKLVKKNGKTVDKGPNSNYVLNSPGAKVGDIQELGGAYSYAYMDQHPVANLNAAKFSNDMINKLKKTYEPLKGKKINPTPLMKIFDKIDSNKDGLIQLYKADIPFVSMMAMSRLMLKHNYKASDINKLGKIRREDFVDEKYDSNKFFGGKGTPKQRTQLLKLQNKALRAFPSSPEQKAVRKEIDALRKKMGMKVKEGFASDAQRKAAFASGYKAKGKKKK